MHGCRRKSWHHDVDEGSAATSIPTSPSTVDRQDTVTGRVQTCPSSACIADSHVGRTRQRGRWRPANSSIPSRAIRRT